MLFRSLGLKACLRHANAVVASHEKIIDGFAKDTGADGKPLHYLGVLYPELDEREVLSTLMVDKKPFIELTGSITAYRQKWIERINRRLISLGMSKIFGHCMAFPFSQLESDRPVDRGAFSLHPPQTRTWPYCSPTRIYRALTVDHNLPVLTHHFHQNPIEDVCLVYEGGRSLADLLEMHSDPIALRDFVEPRIKAYNGIAATGNDYFVTQVRDLMNASEQGN